MNSQKEILFYLRQRICEFKGWTEIDSVPVDRSWYEFGMDSVDLAGLSAFILDDFDIDVDHDVLYEKDTIEDLSLYIYNLRTAEKLIE